LPSDPSWTGAHVEDLACRRPASTQGDCGGHTRCPWASELAVACEKARADHDGRELIVDLRSVTGIGPEGERVLLQLMKDKTKLQCGVYVRELLRQLIRSTQLNALDARDALNDADLEG
jgi:hypothetical protein